MLYQHQQPSMKISSIWICHFFFSSLSVGLISAHNHFRDDCQAAKCEFQLTSEHSAQMAFIQYLGISEADCVSKLSRVNLPDFSAVYCSDEKFCGLDLSPENTKALTPYRDKNCSVFTKQISFCSNLEEHITQSGSVSFLYAFTSSFIDCFLLLFVFLLTWIFYLPPESWLLASPRREMVENFQD